LVVGRSPQIARRTMCYKFVKILAVYLQRC
jgi:hypothetical protein